MTEKSTNQKRTIQEILKTESLPDMLRSNLHKLKAAYRHPFEYINPRFYQKREVMAAQDPADETAQAKFFVDNEEEYQVF